MADLIVFATTIIIIVFIIPLFTSGIKAIRYHDNYFNIIREKYYNMFHTIADINPYLIIIVPLIIFCNIYVLIVESGANVQIGSFFEARDFTAKYQATVKVADTGSLSKFNTILLDIDGETVDVIIEKDINEKEETYRDEARTKYYTEYHINSIEFKNYVFNDDNFKEQNTYSSSQIQINETLDFTPTAIYRYGKEVTIDGDFPTFEVTLSDVFLEKLSNNEFTQKYFECLVSYIVFMCLLVIYLTWVVHKIKNSKKASIIAFVITLIISILLVMIPLNYIYSNAYSNVSENSVASSKTYQNSEITTFQIDEYEGVYLLNPDSMKIHRYDCYTIKHKENFIKTTDYEEAIEEGYEPCQVCKPEDEFTALVKKHLGGLSDAKKAEEKMNKFNELTDKELEKRLKHIKKTDAKRVEKYRKLQKQADENFNKIQQREKNNNMKAEEK